ncbi:MAG: UDP-4-amino-4,6-dideoxy-N-acetyl-beta-L-altrosamine transaminase [Verrucomicrobia bacterium]|nr:UDP-4-amino-4,6-dideoxy-N-acetyl-beta-L-altrosamine transaminase [Verrucomicrobiota bacterium]
MSSRTEKSARLAIDGGTPIRDSLLPYSRHLIDEDDVAAVTEVLRSDWLTTGPKVAEFERRLADRVGTSEAVAVSSGTAALHTAMSALQIGPGDEVIVPAITFAASANCVLYRGGKPTFADVEATTLLLDPDAVEAAITARTKAIVAVDYAGQPCDYSALHTIAERNGLALVADACHALGATYHERPVGSLAELNVFSFHPVKHVASGEGGAITTADTSLAAKMRIFRNHGITTDHHERAKAGGFSYGMEELGYNYRLSDLQCALGLSQLNKLSQSIERRRAIARRYDDAFTRIPAVQSLRVRPGVGHAYHLYPVQFDLARLSVGRAQIYAALRAENIGVNVHYVPVYWHPYYQKLGYARGLCPVAEAAYDRLMSLPIFNGMCDGDDDDVINATEKVVMNYLA